MANTNPVDIEAWPTGGDECDLIELLTSAGILDLNSIVNEGVAVVDASRRNQNFVVLVAGQPKFMVKTADELDKLATLEHEKAIYAYLREWCNKSPDLTSFLPTVAATGPGVIVLGWRKGSMNLREVTGRSRSFTARVAAQAGRGMAAVHGVTSDSLQRPPLDVLPWIQSATALPLHVVNDFSLANHEHLRMIQASSDAGEHLNNLSQSWMPTCLCHGDIRWDNCIAFPASGIGPRRSLNFIDWELAALSDPAWDIGCFFAEYIACWITSIAPTRDLNYGGDVLGFPEIPLGSMQPAIRAFWYGYNHHSQAKSVGDETILRRAAGWTGARLLHTAFEQGQQAVKPTAISVTLLQVGINILRAPEEAAASLLGLNVYA
jgi:hypothetical protein